MILQTLKRIRKIILRNITLIIGYLINIIIIERLSKKGVYQSNERLDIFIKNSLIYANLQLYDQYQVLKNRLGFNIKLLVEYLVYAITKRNTRLDKGVKKLISMTNKVIIAEFIYIMLAYFSPEVINHLESVIKDVKIDIFILSSITVQCETYGVSKVIKLISRKINNEEMIRKLKTI